MTKKLLLSGYYGFDNSGDDAILKAIVENLDGDYELTALSKSPEKTKKEYKINAVDRFSISEVYKAMKETDVFVFGGGSLLQDITSSRSLYYYLSLIILAKFLNKKVFVFANGVGPIEGKFNRFITKKVLNSVDYITLRDEASYKFTKFIGVENENIEVTADPVFLIESSSEERADEILEEQGIELGENVLAISIRDWKTSPGLARDVAKFCDKLIDKDIDILVVPMHYPYDVEYSEMIKVLSKNERIYVLNNKYEVEDIIALLKKATAVIAMRLHALIYSAKANTPILGLIYDPKVTGLIDELSVSEYVRVEDANPEILFDKFKSLMENLDDRKESIERTNKRQEEMAKKTVHLLEELVDSGRDN